MIAFMFVHVQPGTDHLKVSDLNTLENSSKCFKEYTKFKFSGNEKPVKTSALLPDFLPKINKKEF